MTWVDETNPPADDSPQQEVDYELGMDIVYRNGTGKNVPAVYEGASANGTKHTIRIIDGARIDVNNINIKLIDQPYFWNIPKTPLDNFNEVRTGLSLKEAQNLAIPRTLLPLQQELMSWNTQLHHLTHNFLLSANRIITKATD